MRTSEGLQVPFVHRAAGWIARVGRPFSVVLLVLAFGIVGVAWAGAGRLAPGDEQLGSGEYYDRFPFVGAAGDVVVIELSSSEFDPYLILIDGNEQVLAQEDDSPGMGLGARLTVTLPSSGQYTVIVTSAFAGETGGYRLAISTQEQAASAPTTAPSTPTQPVAGAQPRSVTGTVVDTQGRPIVGARVQIQPALTTGVVEVRTDANGRYLAEGLIDMPYTAKAWTTVEYGGRQVCFRLGMESPTDFDAFLPAQGVVRNFVMRLTGEIEDRRGSFFGGELRVGYAEQYASSGGLLEFSFTPRGPLIDGTWTAPFTRTIDPRHEASVDDVPIAAYDVSVALVRSDGSRRPIRSWPEGGDPTGIVAIDWTSEGHCGNLNGFRDPDLYLELPD